MHAILNVGDFLGFLQNFQPNEWAIMADWQIPAAVRYVHRWIRSRLFQRLEIDISNIGHITSFNRLRRDYGNGDVATVRRRSGSIC